MNKPYAFQVPEQKKIRLIINTDAKNEADDQFAIVQALLTPKFLIKGIIGAHFGTRRTTRSMQESYEEVLKLLDLMDMTGQVPVYPGAAHALPDIRTGVPSPGAQAIMEEAHADDPRPLYVIFLGPLTDMASAYLADPTIVDKLTCIWIGGGDWPVGGDEFNLSNDIHAANVVFQSGMPVWQVPRDVYSMMRVSFAELAYKVRPCGKIGRYLFDQMMDFNAQTADNPGWPMGESWSLGDSPAVGLLLDEHLFDYDVRPVPWIDEQMHYLPKEGPNTLRVYRKVDARFILEDFFCKLLLQFGEKDINQ